MNLKFSIPDPMLREVDALAKEKDQSRSWIINAALDGYLERQHKLHLCIREAIADADEHPDHFVAHDDVAREFLASFKK